MGLRDQCSGCGQINQLVKTNTTVHRFGRTPKYDYIRVVCPECRFKTIIFNVSPADLRKLIDNGCTLRSDIRAADVIIKMYDNSHPDFTPLTAHQENQVAFFRYLLDKRPFAPSTSNW